MSAVGGPGSGGGARDSGPSSGRGGQRAWARGQPQSSTQDLGAMRRSLKWMLRGGRSRDRLEVRSWGRPDTIASKPFWGPAPPPTKLPRVFFARCNKYRPNPSFEHRFRKMYPGAPPSKLRAAPRRRPDRRPTETAQSWPPERVPKAITSKALVNVATHGCEFPWSGLHGNTACCKQVLQPTYPGMCTCSTAKRPPDAVRSESTDVWEVGAPLLKCTYAFVCHRVDVSPCSIMICSKKSCKCDTLNT